MSDDVLEARPPDVLDRARGRASRCSVFGLEGEATPLDGERDRNFRIDTAAARSCSRSATPPMRRAPSRCRCSRWSMRCGPTRRCRSPVHGGRSRAARPDRSRSAASTMPSSSSRSSTDRRFRSGPNQPGARVARSAPPWPASTRRSRGSPTPRATGTTVGRGARSPSSDPSSPTSRPSAARSSSARSTATRPSSSPRSRSSPLSTIHGDVNPGNVLVDRDDPERVAGDRRLRRPRSHANGDRPRHRRRLSGLRCADPLDPLVDVVTAYHAVRPLTTAELALIPDLAARAWRSRSSSRPGAPSSTRTTSTTSWPTQTTASPR